MLLTITIALAAGLVITWLKLAGHRRALRSLRLSLERRQPFLRDSPPGASGHEWDEFCTIANRLIIDLSTLEKQQSGRLAQLDATLGSLQEAVMVVDSYNHIILANNGLRYIFPRGTKIIDQRLEVVLHSVTFFNYVEAVRKGQGTPQHAIEFVDGNDARWVEVTGTPIPALDGGKGKWALFVLHDITRQKRLELVRKEFVANVSHELRTPLCVIKGYVETLVDGHEDMDLSDRTRFLATIHRHTERLNSLLEDLLTLSRLESIHPGLQRESTSLHTLVEGIVEDYESRPAAAAHKIDREIDPAIEKLLIDPLKLTQVFENLLDNALKYTPANSRISISARRRTDEVLIHVRDTGPGIPAPDLPHIFERFYRVEKGRSREKGGTGLGLSIVKHIIQLHGGRVRAESQRGEGTCFVLSLPLSTPTATTQIGDHPEWITAQSLALHRRSSHHLPRQCQSKRPKPSIQQRITALRGVLADLPWDHPALTLEIGCGHGHFLTAYAEAHADEFCVAVDIIKERLEKAARKSICAGLTNVAWIRGTAEDLLEALPPEARFNRRVFVLFPDPWPKRRHWKNRLMQPAFLDKLTSRTTTGTQLCFRTDHSSYFAQAHHIVDAHPQWALQPSAPWPFEHQTVFEAKASSHQSWQAEHSNGPKDGSIFTSD